MGIAIIGTGAIAEVHAEALTSAGTEIVAVSGIDADQVADFANRFKVRSRYQDQNELLQSDLVSAVIVATPSQFHSEITIEALKRDKAVLCEVPLALDWESYEKVQLTAGESKTFVAVAQTLRYSQPHLRLKEILTERHPELLNILIRNLMFRQENVGWTGVKRSWVDSVVWHHGSHAFDLASWLLSSQVIHAEIHEGPVWSNGQVMEVNGFLLTEAGHSATVSLSYHSRISQNDVVVITESDTYEISKGRLVHNDETLLSSAKPDYLFFDAVQRQDLAFSNALNTGDLSGVILVNQLEEIHRWLARV